jgi:hypothetical protein
MHTASLGEHGRINNMPFIKKSLDSVLLLLLKRNRDVVEFLSHKVFVCSGFKHRMP